MHVNEVIEHVYMLTILPSRSIFRVSTWIANSGTCQKKNTKARGGIFIVIKVFKCLNNPSKIIIVHKNNYASINLNAIIAHFKYDLIL